MFTLLIPPKPHAPSSGVRAPKYVSAYTNSFAVSAPGMTPQVVRVNDAGIGSSSCTTYNASGWTQCKMQMVMPAGSYAAKFAAYASTDGSGTPLSIVVMNVTIAAGIANTLPSITLAGVPASLALTVGTPDGWTKAAAQASSKGSQLALDQARYPGAPEPAQWFQGGHADTAALNLIVKDAAGSVIAPISFNGAPPTQWTYADANGNAIAVTLQSSDAHLTVPPAVTSTAATSGSITFDGQGTSDVTITAKAPGLPDAKAVIKVLPANMPFGFSVNAPSPLVQSGVAGAYPLKFTGYDAYGIAIPDSTPWAVPASLVMNTSGVTLSSAVYAGGGTTVNVVDNGITLPEALDLNTKLPDNTTNPNYGAAWDVSTTISAPIISFPASSSCYAASYPDTGTVCNATDPMTFTPKATLYALQPKPSGVITANPASLSSNGFAASGQIYSTAVTVHEPYYYMVNPNWSAGPWTQWQKLSGTMHVSFADSTKCVNVANGALNVVLGGPNGIDAPSAVDPDSYTFHVTLMSSPPFGGLPGPVGSTCNIVVQDDIFSPPVTIPYTFSAHP